MDESINAKTFQKIQDGEFNLAQKLDESMDGLRAQLQAGSHAGFFHHDFHPDLLLAMHQLHETLFKIHLSIKQRLYHHLFYLNDEANRHVHELKKFFLEQKLNLEATLVLTNIIKIADELIIYLELLYDNRYVFEEEQVEKEVDLLLERDRKKNELPYVPKTQYHAPKEVLPSPELKYKRYYLYPHPEPR